MMNDDDRMIGWLRLPHMKSRGALLLALTLLACRATSNPSPSNEVGGPQGQPNQPDPPAASAAPPASTPTAPSEQSPAPLARSPMIARQPLLHLRRDIAHCPYEIYVNGGLVERNGEALPTSGMQPINHWLRSGENEVAVHMYKWPEEPDECDVSVSLELSDASQAQASPVTLMTLVHKAKQAPPGDPTQGSSPAWALDSRRAFQQSAQGDVRVGPATVAQLTGALRMAHVLRRNITLSLPFPEWAFFRSDRLRTFADVESFKELRPEYDALLSAYERMWALLDKQDVDGFADACEERSRELDLGYYKQPGETRAALRQQLIATMKDAALKLNTLDLPAKKVWQWIIGPGGQVSVLTEGSDATPILRYPRKDGGAFSIIFPVMFRRENGRYIVTR